MSPAKKILFLLAIVCNAVFSRNALAEPTLERPKTLTSMSPTTLVSVLREAHLNQYGKEPSRARLAMAWAQVALENDSGRIVWNHNIGNVAPGPDNTYYKHTPRVRYRAYDNFVDGAMMYWRVVVRCWPALRAFDAGLPLQAAEKLKACGYYEAELDLYVKGLERLYRQALFTVIPDEERERRDTAQRERERVEYEKRTQFSPRCGCCDRI